MSIREKLADWISGGEITRLIADNRSLLSGITHEVEAAIALERDVFEWNGKALKAETARDEALKEAQHWKSCDRISKQYLTAKADALRAILTARTITEARKIARDALGDE